MIDLFQRNFDVDAKRSVHGAATANAEAISELKAQLEAARQEGFEAGRTLGRQEASSEFAATEDDRIIKEREAIQEQLVALVATDTQRRIETERDIVDLFSGIAERLVPELLETYGTDLAVARIRDALAQVRSDPVLSIKAAPDVITVLETMAPGWLTPAAQNAQIDLVSDPQMNRGAVQVNWKGGRLEYDLHAACLEMLKALALAAEAYHNTAGEVE